MGIRQSIGKLSGIRQDLKAYGMLTEIFVQQQYYLLFRALKPNTTVIDVGAFMGDTAIYFAQSPNVDMVIAYEPIPATYRKGLSLLEKTPPELRRKIDYRNGAIGSAPGSILLSENYVGSGSTRMQDAAAGKGASVQVADLNMVTKEIDGRIALKIDCEGDEFLVLKGADLSKAYAIMLEYHSEELKRQIAERLEKEGFKIEYVGPSLLFAER